MALPDHSTGSVFRDAEAGPRLQVGVPLCCGTPRPWDSRAGSLRASTERTGWDLGAYGWRSIVHTRAAEAMWRSQSCPSPLLCARKLLILFEIFTAVGANYQIKSMKSMTCGLGG